MLAAKRKDDGVHRAVSAADVRPIGGDDKLPGSSAVSAKRLYLYDGESAPTHMEQQPSRPQLATIELEAAIERLLAARAARDVARRKRWLPGLRRRRLEATTPTSAFLGPNRRAGVVYDGVADSEGTRWPL